MSTEIANGHVLSISRLPVKLRNLLILREIIFFLYLARFTVASPTFSHGHCRTLQ